MKQARPAKKPLTIPIGFKELEQRSEGHKVKMSGEEKARNYVKYLKSKVDEVDVMVSKDACVSD